MANYITDEGICLRVTDFSETSQIVGMFTRRHGLVPLIAKGAKRASKKNVMSGPLDLLTQGEVVFVPAKEIRHPVGTPSAPHGPQLGTLSAWELADHRQPLRNHLPALNAAMMCAEITTHLLQPLDPHEDLFDQLSAALHLVADPKQSPRTLVSYMKAALLSAGYWPQFSACLKCGKKVSDISLKFSPRAGGILCAGNNLSCSIDNAGTTISLPGRIAAGLDRLVLPAILLQNPPDRAADNAALGTAAQILAAHIEAITDKPLRTRDLLRTIFVNAPF